MVINIEFQICGLIILMLVAALYNKRRTVWMHTDRVFGVFISIAMISNILDIASIYSINYRDNMPSLINEIICKLYLYSLALESFVTLLYFMADVFRKKDGYGSWLKRVFVVMMAVGLMYFVLPIDYYVDTVQGSIYTLGPAVNYTYAVCVLVLVISLCGLIRQRRKVSSFRRNPVLLIIISFILAAGIQFMNNSLLIVSFAIDVSVLLIYMFMENPADKLDEDTGMYNVSMLKTYIDRQYVSGRKFFVISVSIRSYDTLFRTFGISNICELIVCVARYFKKMDNVLLFRLGENRFAISGLYDEEYYDKVISFLDDFEKEIFPISNTTISLGLDMCILKDSSLLNDGEEVMHYINSLLPRTQQDGLCYVNKESIEDIDRCNNIEGTLRWAIDNDMFTVYYQPIYSIEKNRFVSMEALIRLWDEQGEFIPLDIFIPIAERNGMITEIDMMVLSKVCKFVVDNDPSRYGIEFIEVNLSVVQCMQTSLAKDLKRVLDYYGISPEYIHFEITETAMADSKKTLLDNMDKLIGYGSAFYLDDYGSGYANLNFLVDLPFKAAKLDKELVCSYYNNKKGQIATKYAIDMLKNLNMEIVAEGIETKEQLEQMKELGVQYIQGYYLSRPLCETDLVELLKENRYSLSY